MMTDPEVPSGRVTDETSVRDVPRTVACCFERAEEVIGNAEDKRGHRDALELIARERRDHRSIVEQTETPATHRQNDLHHLSHACLLVRARRSYDLGRRGEDRGH